MRRIVVPGAALVIVIIAYVGLGGWNRSAAPRQVIVLTERELSLPWVGRRSDDENPGVQLRIEIERRNDPLDARNWLSEDRLRALGFTLNVPAGAPEAAEVYDNVPPRVGWVALEYDGPAFREIERRRALNRDSAPWRGLREPTRLVPVDAGPDYDTLFAKYSSGHVILQAVIELSYIPPRTSPASPAPPAPIAGPLLYGWVREVVPATITVPRQMTPLLEQLTPQSAGHSGPPLPPRYEAEIAVGPLGVPYVRWLR